MHKVILDTTLRSKLNHLDEQVEFCDETGRTVGYFLPAELHDRLCYEWAKSQFSDEELEQTGGNREAAPRPKSSLA